MPCLITTLSAPNGRALSNRYRIRRFAHSCDMHTFLCKGDNGLHWRELKGVDIKSGVYFSQTDRGGTRYIPESALR